MKTKILFICAILFTLISNFSYSQVIKKEISIQQIDSLINKNIDISKLDSIGKINLPGIKTRGANPCESDYDNVIMLFKSLKSNYASCCNGNTNPAAIARISASIYSLLNNPNCEWGVGQWLAFTYYLNDYASFVERNNCCK